MKALIAIVMFLFGLFVGILSIPFIKEFSTPLYVEEEYSTPRVKTLLRNFNITLPLEAMDVNLFFKQDASTSQVWVKFECSPEVKDTFVDELKTRHSGLFNRDVEMPKMFDGTVITWWSYRNTYRFYEFHDMCVAYDDILRNLYVYAISDGSSDGSGHEDTRSSSED